MVKFYFILLVVELVLVEVVYVVVNVVRHDVAFVNKIANLKLLNNFYGKI
jgi:hypothetical protein